MGRYGGTTAYLWVGDSPAEVSDRCGGCCLFCLSAFALAWWLVCGWLAILPLACDLRTTSVPSDHASDFLPWATPLGYPLAFLALDFSLALRVWAANL